MHIMKFLLAVVVASEFLFAKADWIESVRKCCLNNDWTISDPTSTSSTVNASIALISSYGSRQSDINTIIALRHGYEHHIVKSTEEGKDPRWNKVSALKTAFKNKVKADYLIWMDPQFLLINLSFQIHSWIDLYPNADIITLGQSNGKGSSVTTGLIILRNSKFSQHFINLWWGFDGHDMDDEEFYHNTLVDKFLSLNGDEGHFVDLRHRYETGKLSSGSLYNVGFKTTKDKTKFAEIPKGIMSDNFPFYQTLSNVDRSGPSRPPAIYLRYAIPEFAHTLHSRVMDYICAAVQNVAVSDNDIASKAAATTADAMYLSPTLNLSVPEVLGIAVNVYTEHTRKLRIALLDAVNQSANTVISNGGRSVGLTRLFEQFESSMIVFADALVQSPEYDETNKKATLFGKRRMHDAHMVVVDMFEEYVSQHRSANAQRMKDNNNIGLEEWPALLSRAVNWCARTVELSGDQLYLSSSPEPYKGTNDSDTIISAEDRKNLVNRCMLLAIELEGIANKEYLPFLRTIIINLLTSLAEVELRQKDYDKALKSARRALSYCYEQQSINNCFIMPNFILGEVFLAKQNWREAISLYDGIISIMVGGVKEHGGKDKYDFSGMPPQGSSDVNTVLFRMAMGRGFALAQYGDIGRAEEDMLSGQRFLYAIAKEEEKETTARREEEEMEGGKEEREKEQTNKKTKSRLSIACVDEWLERLRESIGQATSKQKMNDKEEKRNEL